VTAAGPPDGDGSRRAFLRKAAGGLAAPLIISLSLDHMRNRAWAQQAYQPLLTAFEQVGADEFRLTFSMAMDTASSCLTVWEYPALVCGGAPTVYSGVGFDPRFDQWQAGGTVLIWGGWPPDSGTRSMSLVLNPGTCSGGQRFASAGGIPLAEDTLSPCLDLSGSPRHGASASPSRKAGYR
jgi:hypothetical protein